RLTRAQIKAIPDGDYAFEDYLDDDGVDLGRRVKFAVTIRVRGSSMTFDFTGTDPQVRGPFNSVPASTMSAVFYAVRAISDASIPKQRGWLPAGGRRAAAAHTGDPTPPPSGGLTNRPDQAHRRHAPRRARQGTAGQASRRQLRHASRHVLRRRRPRHRQALCGE